MSRTITHTHKPASPRAAKGILTPFEWAEMRDALTLALEALGNGPEDVCKDFFVNCVINQRVAIRIAHARLEKLH